jgi:hypothetical protein
VATVNLKNVMNGLATLATTGNVAKNVYAYPIAAPAIPCFVVAYPTAIDFDLTYGRGGDTLSIPCYFLTGQTTGTDARDALSAAIDGAAGVKDALDGPSSFGDIRVESAAIEEVTVGAVTYIGVKFTVGVLT